MATNFASDNVSIFLGNGSGSFAAAMNYAVGDGPYTAVTGDYNNDGITDIVAGNFIDNTVTVLSGDGDGTFTLSGTYNTNGTNLATLVNGDFNGDGVLDLVSANSVSDDLTVMIGQGGGVFTAGVSYATGGTVTRSVTTEDFNGDGILDLAGSNRDSNNITVFMGQGDGTFASAVSYAAGDGTRTVTAGDFNGDGVYDLVTGNETGGTVSFLSAVTTSGTAPLLNFSLKTMADARQALPMLQNKADQLSIQQGKIGAFEARVTSAINVLGSTRENYLSAESKIRDADIAQESANLLRATILQQAEIAIMAQANQQPQLALELLS